MLCSWCPMTVTVKPICGCISVLATYTQSRSAGISSGNSCCKFSPGCKWQTKICKRSTGSFSYRSSGGNQESPVKIDTDQKTSTERRERPVQGFPWSLLEFPLGIRNPPHLGPKFKINQVFWKVWKSQGNSTPLNYVFFSLHLIPSGVQLEREELKSQKNGCLARLAGGCSQEVPAQP